MSAPKTVSDAQRKAEPLLEAIRELVRLEDDSQTILKMPAEQLLDSLPESLERLESQKLKWMRTVDRYAVEWTAYRGSARPATPELAETHARLIHALRGLQRVHQDNERILGLRMTLLSEDLRQIERSRRFLRSTLQSVAA